MQEAGRVRRRRVMSNNTSSQSVSPAGSGSNEGSKNGCLFVLVIVSPIVALVIAIMLQILAISCFTSIWCPDAHQAIFTGSWLIKITNPCGGREEFDFARLLLDSFFAFNWAFLVVFLPGVMSPSHRVGIAGTAFCLGALVSDRIAPDYSDTVPFLASICGGLISLCLIRAAEKRHLQRLSYACASVTAVSEPSVNVGGDDCEER